MRLTLSEYFHFVETTRLALLPREVREFVLEGYLCTEYDGCFWLGEEPHSPCHVSNGRAVCTPRVCGDVTLWFLYGKLHRLGGPAVEYIDGRREYYEYGFRIYP